MNLAKLHELALDTNGKMHQLAAGVGRNPMIYLHWSAGRYGQDFKDYHIRIDKDGELYVNPDLAEKLAHTWKRNTGAIGVALLCCYNATTVNFGKYPPTAKQIETMAQVIAVLCDALQIPIDKKHVMTHAEVADADGYGPAQDCQRWDLWMLSPTQARGSGGEILRNKAKWYATHEAGE